MKYIDADKLIAEIERRKKSIDECPFIEAELGASIKRDVKIKTFNELLSLIDSLQQEQPETDMKSPFTGGKVAILSREEEVTFRGEKVKILRKYYRCEDTGREFTDSKLDDDMMWDVFRAYCEKKGMTSFTDIMLKQEQPEVELEKEIDKCFEIVRGEDGFAHICSLDSSLCDDWKKSPYVVNKPGFIHFAKHFYELGLNARKEK